MADLIVVSDEDWRENNLIKCFIFKIKNKVNGSFKIVNDRVEILWLPDDWDYANSWINIDSSIFKSVNDH